MTPLGPVTYGSIYAAAIVEGEVVFVAACVAVAAGQLAPLPVLLAGALGAATGDQFYFYLLRGRVSRWLSRFKPLASRRAAVVERVKRHQVPMILALRFAPGLRIAIAAACAFANVPPLRFTLLNTFTAFIWAAVLLELVTHLGPAALAQAGIGGVWSAVIAGVVLIIGGLLLGRVLKSKPDGSGAR